MTITAVITTYNRRALLLEALDSVKAQSRPPDEILVIDDGSTDGTEDQMKDTGVRYHRQQNAGTSAARNTGWQLATGDWIAFLDCDDLWEKDKLFLQESAAHQADLDAIFGHASNFVGPSEVDRFQSPWHRLGVPVPGWLPGTALVRKSLLEAMGGFDPTVKTAEVVDWIMRLRGRGAKTLMLSQTVLQRRLHVGNKQLESNLGQQETFALLRRWRTTQPPVSQVPHLP